MRIHNSLRRRRWVFLGRGVNGCEMCFSSCQVPDISKDNFEILFLLKVSYCPQILRSLPISL